MPYPLLPKYLAAIIWIPNATSFEKTSALNSQAEFFTKRVAVLFFSGAIAIHFSSGGSGSSTHPSETTLAWFFNRGVPCARGNKGQVLILPYFGNFCDSPGYRFTKSIQGLLKLGQRRALSINTICSLLYEIVRIRSLRTEKNFPEILPERNVLHSCDRLLG